MKIEMLLNSRFRPVIPRRVTDANSAPAAKAPAGASAPTVTADYPSSVKLLPVHPGVSGTLPLPPNRLQPATRESHVRHALGSVMNGSGFLRPALPIFPPLIPALPGTDVPERGQGYKRKFEGDDAPDSKRQRMEDAPPQWRAPANDVTVASPGARNIKVSSVATASGPFALVPPAGGGYVLVTKNRSVTVHTVSDIKQLLEPRPDHTVEAAMEYVDVMNELVKTISTGACILNAEEFKEVISLGLSTLKKTRFNVMCRLGCDKAQQISDHVLAVATREPVFRNALKTGIRLIPVASARSLGISRELKKLCDTLERKERNNQLLVPSELAFMGAALAAKSNEPFTS